MSQPLRLSSNERARLLLRVFRDPVRFCQAVSGVRLRSYQQVVARHIIDSVLGGQGLSFVVIFPRQSGKNELQAQIETYLLALFARGGAEIVKASPTLHPQAANAMHRLERVLEGNLLTRGRWKKEGGRIYRVGRARITFLSGAPEAHIVGATASTLLEVDEAQDVTCEKYDRDIAPMAASTNATRVFWGTAWTSQTLLARERRAALAAEREDGIRRVFVLDAPAVMAEVPPYRLFVAAQVSRFGRSHPLVKTQYFSEEIEAESPMFPPGRIALMQGSHPPLTVPRPGGRYALLLDVAGEYSRVGEDSAPEDHRAAEDSAGEGGRRGFDERDATALTVVEVDPATLSDDLLRAPTYRVVMRRAWQGAAHTDVYAAMRALALHWNAARVVVDATGIGAGLASFLQRALPGRVIPFVFNAASKSRLGWDFIALVEAGRFKDYAVPDGDSNAFLRQLQHCQMDVQTGPEQRLKWGVPDGMRDADGSPIHDDWVLSAALAAVLDGVRWGAGSPALVVSRPDPLRELDEGF